MIKRASKGILQFGFSTEQKFAQGARFVEDKQPELIKNIHLQQQFERFEQKMKNRDLKKNVTKSVTPVEKDSKKEIEENSSDDGSLMNGK